MGRVEWNALSVKVERPENYEGDKVKDLDTWLFQVRKHLELSTVPAGAYVAYAASLLRGNAAMWWRGACEAHRRPTTWEDFCRALHDQFRPEDYGHRGRDKWQRCNNTRKKVSQILCTGLERHV